MSLYKEIKTEFRNAKSLANALIDMGYKLECLNPKANNMSLYGYQGDQRPEKAAIVIRRKDVGRGSNDVGFAWDGKQYTAIVSQYDQQTNFNADRQRLLKKLYCLHEIKRQARIKGYTIRQEQDAHGVIRLTLTHQ